MIELQKSRIVLVFMTLTMIAAGCTETNDAGAGAQGVEITEFSANPVQIYDNQDSSLEMILTNTGGSDAEDLEVETFNLPSDWEVGEFDFPEVIRGPDEDAGISAQPFQSAVTLTPEEGMDERAEVQQDVGARIEYWYESFATTEIQIMSDDRFREEQVQTTRPAVNNIDAPVQIDVQTTTPIVFYGGEASNNIRIVVRNDGGGVPMIEDENGELQEDHVNVNIDTFGSGELGKDSEEVQLIGSEGSFSTSIDIDSDDFDGSISETMLLEITADYKYRQEDNTLVTVRGTE